MTLRLPQMPSADDGWRLLTRENTAVRRLWPWSHSIQKLIDLTEPRPRGSANLLISSDYGGEHPGATHNIYCYLVIRGGAGAWASAIREARRTFLPTGRVMAYKRLDDPHRQAALASYLQAAANLDGHLVAIAVDKRKKWLSTFEGRGGGIRKLVGLKANWNTRACEAMMRKVHFAAILLSIWSRPYSNVKWITDRDEFVQNDTRHDDALLAVARMSSLYMRHPIGEFRLNTTGQLSESAEFEDLCSIPDLAAGMLSDVATRLATDEDWRIGFEGPIKMPLPLKAEIISDWFWDQTTRLRKTMISIDVRGAQYSVHKMFMRDGGVIDGTEYGPDNMGGEGPSLDMGTVGHGWPQPD